MVILKSVTLQEIYITAIISQVQFLVGFGYSFSALLIPKILDDENSILNPEAISWIATSGLILRPLGNAVDMYIIDKLGRRNTLRLKLFLIFISWTTVAFSKTTVSFCVGRSVSSLAIGFIATKSLYISETCNEQHRATLLSITLLFMSLGIVVVNFLQYFISWKKTATIASLVSLATLVQTYYIPETKYWYMLKNRKREAFRSSLWFRNKNNPIEIQNELNKIEKSISQTPIKSNILTLLKKPIILKPFLASLALLMCRLGTGYVIFTHYTVSFFSSMDVSYDSEKLSILIAILDLLANILFTLVAGKFNRRTVLYISTIIMIPAILTVAGYLQFNENTESKSKSDSGILLIGIFIYMIVNTSCYFATILVVISEIFPSAIRGPILSLSFFVMHVFMSFYIYYYPIIVENFGLKFVCWFFLINAIASLIITYYLPETRSLPLYDAEELYEERDLILSNDGGFLLAQVSSDDDDEEIVN